MKKILGYIASPFSVGIVSTLIVCYLAFDYYVNKSNVNIDQANNPVFTTLNKFDLLSNDFRMLQRGYLNTSQSNTALLSVDERDLKTVGRWPWSRKTVATAIENTLKYGAKVISADMIFGEPSARPEKELFLKVKESNSIPQNLNMVFENALEESDADKYFSETIGRINNKFILGSVFEGASLYGDSYPEAYVSACYDIVFEHTSAFKTWDQEEVLIIANDPTALPLPDTIKTAYSEHMKSIEEVIRSNYPPPKTSSEAYEINRKVIETTEQFCRSSFLKEGKDELLEAISSVWATIKEQEDLEANSFKEWADRFKAMYSQSSVPQTIFWDMNTSLISMNAINTGFFNAVQDKDGMIRRSPLVIRTGSRYFPSISLKGFLVANNYNAMVNLQESSINPGIKFVKSISITSNETGEEVFQIPVDSQGRMTINYAGPQKMYPHVSFGDMVDDTKKTVQVKRSVFDKGVGLWREVTTNEDKATYLKDKMFILGVTAIGVFDLRVTPFEENYPGAETHVNVFDNLVTRNFLKKHPKEEMIMILFLIVMGIIQSIALARLGALSGLFFTLTLIVGSALIDKYYIYGKGTVVSIIFPLLELSVIYVSMTFYKYFTEERNKKELRSTFSKYVSPAIVDEILLDPDNIELGGRKEHITVFFSDIRGFTTISEKLDPRALSDLLNSYLTPMTDLVFQNRGTLDKYMGDAIMAFFGAPIHYDDHAKYACRCALQSLEKLKELQEEYEAKGLPAIDIGIGLNTGECSVGNMGSETVRSYTVMGDSVNLGSRLEGINKQYGTRIIISEFTFKEVKDSFVCREVDWVRVKGKALPVKIYELIAEEKAPSQIEELLGHFNHGFKLYHEMNFENAIKSFTEALNVNPADMASQLYLQRCRDYIVSPPEDNWDGVFTMKTK